MAGFDPKDVPHYQVMDAFLQQYMKECGDIDILLKEVRDAEYMPNVATESPAARKYIEMHGREDLPTKLMILAIASSVAEAIVAAKTLLQS